MITKNELWDMLDTIHSKKYVGVVSFELIQFAIDKQLIERTPVGNFQLTSKGSDFLDYKLSWDEL